MTLSNKSMKKIAAALAEDVAADLIHDDDWLDFLHTAIGGLIVNKLGQIDDEVLGELIICTADRIGLRSFD